MNIIDTMGVSHILENDLSLNQDYFLVPDVADEVELTQLVHGKQIPVNIYKIYDSDVFDTAKYLAHYNRILNQYGDRSFYNMTGFGDISILATLLMLAEVSVTQVQSQLFTTADPLTVYTDDSNLRTKIGLEFPTGNVILRSRNDIS